MLGFIIDKEQDKLWVFCVLNKLLVDEHDNIVSLNLQPFCPKGKTLSCNGNLNLIAIQPAAETCHLTGHMLKVKQKLF